MFSGAGWRGGVCKHQPLTDRGWVWQLGSSAMKQAFVHSTQRCFLFFSASSVECMRLQIWSQSSFLSLVVKVERTVINLSYYVMSEMTLLEVLQLIFSFQNMILPTKVDSFPLITFKSTHRLSTRLYGN